MPGCLEGGAEIWSISLVVREKRRMLRQPARPWHAHHPSGSVSSVHWLVACLCRFVRQALLRGANVGLPSLYLVRFAPVLIERDEKSRCFPHRLGVIAQLFDQALVPGGEQQLEAIAQSA